jgi:hypothetical protein
MLNETHWFMVLFADRERQKLVLDANKEVCLEVNAWGCQECYLLGCDAVLSGRSSPMFQWNVLSPSTEWRSKPSKQPASQLVTDYTASHLKR